MAIDTQLRRVGARPAATGTKLRRALAGRLPAIGATHEPPLTRHSPAAEVVLAYLREQVAAISRYDPQVRRDEPDAVHQMRVAPRRARRALPAFGGFIDREATRPPCAELKWLAATLGQARDSEVMLDRLTADLAAIPHPGHRAGRGPHHRPLHRRARPGGKDRAGRARRAALSPAAR